MVFCVSEKKLKFLNLSLCIFLLASCVDKSRSNAPELYENPNKKEALRQLLPLASMGDRVASYLVGTIYLRGMGIRQDVSEAFKWLEAAADRGQVCALNDLTFYYKSGINVPKNYAKALSFGNRAIKSNHPVAINTLAQMHYYGQGVPQDKGYAFKAYQKALSLGGHNALGSIAGYYRDRSTQKEDQIEALKWLEIYSIWSKEYKTELRKEIKDSVVQIKETLTSLDIDKAVALANAWYIQNGHTLLSPNALFKKCFE